MNALPAPVYSAAQVRAMDAYAIQQLGIPGYTLMTRAGEAALDLLCDRWPAATRILVLCGAGNNGGDGYVVARLARAAGLEVTVAALLPPTVLRGDALRAWQDYAAAGGEVVGFAASLPEAADVVVDALLGTGLDRPVSGAFAECIRAVSRAGRPVLAIDVPSGLGADTGQVMGIALGASVTITFVGLKAGLFLGAGPDLAGELAFASLGAGDSAPVGDPLMTRLGPSVLAAALPPRRRTAHKGEHGRACRVRQGWRPRRHCGPAPGW